MTNERELVYFEFEQLLQLQQRGIVATLSTEQCTCAAEGETVLVVTEIVAVRAAAAVIECQAIFPDRIEEPTDLCLVAVALSDRLEAVSWRVGATVMVVRRSAPAVALLGRREFVIVASTAAVRERAALSVIAAPVELQHAVEARPCILRQLTQFCEKKITTTTKQCHLHATCTKNTK